MNRLLTKLLLVLCLIGIPIAPAFAQGNPVVLSSLSHSGTIPASPGTGTVNLGAIFSDPNSLAGAYGTVTVTITGGWSGTITPEVQSCDGAGTWTGLQVTPLNSTTGQSTITANGVYSGNVAGFCAVRVRGSSVATAAATATITVGSVGGGAGGGGGGTSLVKSGTYLSSGTDQFALAVTTNTQLTVPATTTCAQITVEGANIRRTSDTTSATTTNGTLIQVGASWQDCGPLAAYKFTAVSGSPTLDVEYFK